MSAGELIHATCVAINGRGVLLGGVSGSGKSDLALRLIDRGAQLVSDDYTLVEARGGTLYARQAPNIGGRIEMRGVGIIERDAIEEAPVVLHLQLDAEPDRLPEPPKPICLCGIDVPSLPFAPFERSAEIKAEAALALHGLDVRP
jgi:serine kinase of HPr protein (carbohydrate metabolism regulator)